MRLGAGGGYRLVCTAEVHPIAAVEKAGVGVAGGQEREERALHEWKSSGRADEVKVGGGVYAEEEARKSVGRRAKGKP
jgi:hypothetical protein